MLPGPERVETNFTPGGVPRSNRVSLMYRRMRPLQTFGAELDYANIYELISGVGDIGRCLRPDLSARFDMGRRRFNHHIVGRHHAGHGPGADL